MIARGFSCGTVELDRYLQVQASQDVRRRVSACYVAIDADTDAVAGYFTLAASGIPSSSAERTGSAFAAVSVGARGIGRAPGNRRAVPGAKAGAALLWDAARRAARSEVIAFALVVDAKDAAAGSFYLRHGFVSLGISRKLVLPLATVAQRC